MGQEGRRFIALFILNLPWWLHFSTSTQNLIIRSLKLPLQVIQLKFHLILRVVFHFVPSRHGVSENPHWLRKELCPLPERKWRKELNPNEKRTNSLWPPPPPPPPPNKRGQTEVGEEVDAISHHFRPSESWLGGANIQRKPLSSELKHGFRFNTKWQYFLTDLAENLAWFVMI